MRPEEPCPHYGIFLHPDHGDFLCRIEDEHIRGEILGKHIRTYTRGSFVGGSDQPQTIDWNDIKRHLLDIHANMKLVEDEDEDGDRLIHVYDPNTKSEKMRDFRSYILRTHPQVLGQPHAREQPDQKNE